MIFMGPGYFCFCGSLFYEKILKLRVYDYSGIKMNITQAFIINIHYCDFPFIHLLLKEIRLKMLSRATESAVGPGIVITVPSALVGPALEGPTLEVLGLCRGQV